MISNYDETELKQIAEMTGGQFFTAQQDGDLEIYDHINSSITAVECAIRQLYRILHLACLSRPRTHRSRTIAEQHTLPSPAMTFENPIWLYLAPATLAAGLSFYGLRQREQLLSQFAAARLKQLTEQASYRRIGISGAHRPGSAHRSRPSRSQYGIEWSERKARGLDIVLLDSSKARWRRPAPHPTGTRQTGNSRPGRAPRKRPHWNRRLCRTSLPANTADARLRRLQRKPRGNYPQA